MLYREMPKTGDRLSILGFGCMRFPGRQTNPNEKKAIEQIRYAVDKGVNYLDTAWPYHTGKSEPIVGKAIKDGYRENVKIATKLPQWLVKSRQDMDHYLGDSLKRLDIDAIDYYLVHALNGASWRRMKELGIIDFLDEVKQSGRIVNAGFSFHGSRDDFREIVDDYDWDFCQIQFNILDEHVQAGIDGLNYACSKNIGVIVMEPLRGGALASKLPDAVEDLYRSAVPERSNAEWALRWVWNHPGVITVLSGMNAMAQIDENITIAETADVGSMSEDELNTVKRASEAFRSLEKVPCTGCQYCMPCPAGVDIPGAFSACNGRHTFNQGLKGRIQYLVAHAGGGGRKPSLPSQCTECGVCVEKCPQGIDIPTELKQVAAEFEGGLGKPFALLVREAKSFVKRKR